MMPLWTSLSNCQCTHKKSRTKDNKIACNKSEQQTWKWMTKHQDALMHWKRHSVLLHHWGILISPGNLYWTDASLNGIGAILSQQGKDRKICVIAYTSHSLCPSERSMHNYSSATLGLLALKLAVVETF